MSPGFCELRLVSFGVGKVGLGYVRLVQVRLRLDWVRLGFIRLGAANWKMVIASYKPIALFCPVSLRRITTLHNLRNRKEKAEVMRRENYRI